MVAEEYRRLLERLDDDVLRKVAILRMEGYTTDEIGAARLRPPHRGPANGLDPPLPRGRFPMSFSPCGTRLRDSDIKSLGGNGGFVSVLAGQSLRVASTSRKGGFHVS